MTDDDKADGEDLAQFGYKQELTRSLGSFSSFAAGFSYLSVMSGMFQLFAFGFGLAGPMVWLSWIVVFAGMMLVALCFAESSAAFPIAGSVYSWATRQGSEAWGWMTGWIMLVASIASVAGVAVAWQISLPTISPAFQFVGDGTGKYDFAENAVVLGLILLALITAANVAGIKVMAKANNLGVMAELLGVSLFIGLLLTHLHRGPGVVVHSMGLPAASNLGVGGAVLIAAIMPGWVMFGFDTAGSLAEETRDPRRRAPRAILNALAAGGGAGAILLLVALMAAPNLRDPKVASQGLPYIVQALLGSGIGKGMLVFVVISTAAGALAIQTATIRFIFAMARDGKLPFGKQLGHVNPKTHTPVAATLVVGIAVALILVATARQPKIFTVITSVSVVLIYLAYAMSLAAQLRNRRRDSGPSTKEAGHFSLGRWGMPINVVGLLFLSLGAINFVWPRPQIYGAGAYRWGGVIFVSLTVLCGLMYRVFWHAPTDAALSEHRIAADLSGPPDDRLAEEQLA
ncbi:MAG: amino acid permease [Frankiales bacterium]|nr:amino acid permease [Frankiales bacterium]